MSLVLPTTILGAKIPRSIEHEQAIMMLCRLRDKYPIDSPEWKALNANAETINRLGGRKDSTLIDNVDDMRTLVSQGYAASSRYMECK